MAAHTASFAYGVRCLSCDSTITLLVGAGVDARQPLFFVCARCHKATRVTLKVWTEGDTLFIKAGAAAPGVRAKRSTVWLALFKGSETVRIERGENRGETITYHKVVREMTPVGQWHGEEVTIKLPKHHLKNRGADGCAVLLQHDTAGPVIAAAEMMGW